MSDKKLKEIEKSLVAKWVKNMHKNHKIMREWKERFLESMFGDTR